MKHIKKLFWSIICIALLITGASTVSAQALDGTWFQIDISAKGLAVDTDDGSVGKLSVKKTGYMFMQWQDPGYNGAIFSENAPGNWVPAATSTLPPYTPTEDILFMPIQQWVIYSPDGTAISIYINGQFNLKLDKDDTLKGAKFTALGALVQALLDPAYETLFAKTKVKVKMIDENKLPAGIPLP